MKKSFMKQAEKAGMSAKNSADNQVKYDASYLMKKKRKLEGM